MDAIHTWWDSRPGERFWLAVVGSDGRRDVIGAPCGEGLRASSWTHRLITHVERGDTVFHYDEGLRAITACSTAVRGARRQRLAWTAGGRCPNPREDAAESEPSWTVELAGTRRLDDPAGVGSIAAAQWDLFPSLHQLEEEVGEPLYYPFAMGSAQLTHLLPGYAFKLPALIVDGLPALAQAVDPGSRSTSRALAVEKVPQAVALIRA